MAKLKIKIFSDGADIETMKAMNDSELIQGLTTNPTLMKKSGISNYESFAQKVLTFVNEKPISFEVFSDDFDEMYYQAKKISSWGRNVYVKIPIINTKGESAFNLIKKLNNEDIKVNITAILSIEQIKSIKLAINKNVQNFISIFAGRIADTGIDPVKIFSESLALFRDVPNSEFIWASPREVYNVRQANDIGCHIITLTSDLINKLSLFDYDLEKYSLDTVMMFYRDAKEAGYNI